MTYLKYKHFKQALFYHTIKVKHLSTLTPAPSYICKMFVTGAKHITVVTDIMSVIRCTPFKPRTKEFPLLCPPNMHTHR